MKRYPGLDLLRAIAILWVLLFHGWILNLGNPWPAIGRQGWMGVDLFFVLSGYLIGSQLLKSYAQGQVPGWVEFYRRRALRILPVYWVVVALYFAVPQFREAKGIEPAWKFLTFTENFLIDYRHNETFSHAWSLCVEEHFYLVMPILVWALLRRPSWRITVTLAALIMIGGIAARAWVYLHYCDPVKGWGPGKFVELIYYPTYMRLDGLLAGVLLASVRWFRPAWWQAAMARPYWMLTAAVGVLAVAIWAAKGRGDFAGSVFGFPLLAAGFALLVAASVSERGFLGKFHVPGAELIAKVTFSLYLSHKMTWHVLRTYAPGWVDGRGVQAFILYTLGAFAVGGALYLLVERPFLRLRDRWETKANPVGL
ncbi:MAG: acyltransferase [Verrucomicrobia bacterium]|nr:acyltransferase [Verrucomicrobiota bacterium]